MVRQTYKFIICSVFISTSAIILAADRNANNAEGIVAMSLAGLDTAPRKIVENQSFWNITEGNGGAARGVEAFSSSDNHFEVGTYAYDKITLSINGYPSDEFMHILKGRVTITDENGHGRTYGPGDSIIMKKGFKGTWRQLEPIKKISVSYNSP